MVRLAAASGAIRDILGDLVLGDHGYLGLKRRLLARPAPPRLDGAFGLASGALGPCAGAGGSPGSEDPPAGPSVR